MSSPIPSEDQRTAADLRTLAFFLAREPDRAVVERLASPQGEEAFGESPVSDVVGPLGPERATEELAVEYARLFIGPRHHFSPVESVQRGDGEHMGPHTSAVLRAYDEAGFELGEECRELPDHVSVELDLVAHLLERERTDEARSFVAAHPLQWVPSWVDSFTVAARWRFYPLVGRRVVETLSSLA